MPHVAPKGVRAWHGSCGKGREPDLGHAPAHARAPPPPRPKPLGTAPIRAGRLGRSVARALYRPGGRQAPREERHDHLGSAGGRAVPGIPARGRRRAHRGRGAGGPAHGGRARAGDRCRGPVRRARLHLGPQPPLPEPPARPGPRRHALRMAFRDQPHQHPLHARRPVLVLPAWLARLPAQRHHHGLRLHVLRGARRRTALGRRRREIGPTGAGPGALREEPDPGQGRLGHPVCGQCQHRASRLRGRDPAEVRADPRLRKAVLRKPS